MRKSLCDSLVREHLFTLENFSSKTDFDFDHRLLVYDTLSRIAIINEELFVANH